MTRRVHGSKWTMSWHSEMETLEKIKKIPKELKPKRWNLPFQSEEKRQDKGGNCRKFAKVEKQQTFGECSFQKRKRQVSKKGRRELLLKGLRNAIHKIKNKEGTFFMKF